MGGGAPLHTFAAVPRGCLQFVIVVFPDHTHYFCQGHYFEKELRSNICWISYTRIPELVQEIIDGPSYVSCATTE